MTNPILDALVKKGVIKKYMYNNVDEDGFVGGPLSKSPMRNSEQLVIVFNTGDMLGIDTICSGSAENTELIFSI